MIGRMNGKLMRQKHAMDEPQAEGEHNPCICYEITDDVYEWCDRCQNQYHEEWATAQIDRWKAHYNSLQHPEIKKALDAWDEGGCHGNA